MTIEHSGGGDRLPSGNGYLLARSIAAIGSEFPLTDRETYDERFKHFAEANPDLLRGMRIAIEASLGRKPESSELELALMGLFYTILAQRRTGEVEQLRSSAPELVLSSIVTQHLEELAELPPTPHPLDAAS